MVPFFVCAVFCTRLRFDNLCKFDAVGVVCVLHFGVSYVFGFVDYFYIVFIVFCV